MRALPWADMLSPFQGEHNIGASRYSDTGHDLSSQTGAVQIAALPFVSLNHIEETQNEFN